MLYIFNCRYSGVVYYQPVLPVHSLSSVIKWKVKLSSVNVAIEWKRKDEIGELVNEYNKMVGKAGCPVPGCIGKSEREGAWREMARQVALKIKIRLHRMKLSLPLPKKPSGIIPDNVRTHCQRCTNIGRSNFHLSQIAVSSASLPTLVIRYNETFVAWSYTN